MIIKTRRQVNEAKAKLERVRRSKIKGNQPARDALYLAFVRGFLCVGCFPICYRDIVSGMWDKPITEMRPDGIYGNERWCGRTEAAHMGPHGISQKASDYAAIPLGRGHHEKIGSSIKKLEALGINYPEFVKRLREAYEQDAAIKEQAND